MSQWPRQMGPSIRTGVRYGGSEHADDEQRPNDDPTTIVLRTMRT